MTDSEHYIIKKKYKNKNGDIIIYQYPVLKEKFLKYKKPRKQSIKTKLRSLIRDLDDKNCELIYEYILSEYIK